VIKAPAGFGKTSLAVSWSEWLGQHGSSVAWLTIDTDDNEPSRFSLYVAQAIRRAAPEVGADALGLVRETFLINPRAIVSSLINDLSDLDEEFYLFLEDYHWVNDRGIHDAVSFFLKNAPSHAHLILTTRTEPPPLPSLLPAINCWNRSISVAVDLQETRDLLDREAQRFDASRCEAVGQKPKVGLPAADRRLYLIGEDFGLHRAQPLGVLRPMDDYLAEIR
jgi:LuxR family maltose regulon positive regulatory protein